MDRSRAHRQDRPSVVSTTSSSTATSNSYNTAQARHSNSTSANSTSSPAVSASARFRAAVLPGKTNGETGKRKPLLGRKPSSATTTTAIPGTTIDEGAPHATSSHSTPSTAQQSSFATAPTGSSPSLTHLNTSPNLQPGKQRHGSTATISSNPSPTFVPRNLDEFPRGTSAAPGTLLPPVSVQSPTFPPVPKHFPSRQASDSGLHETPPRSPSAASAQPAKRRSITSITGAGLQRAMSLHPAKSTPPLVEESTTNPEAAAITKTPRPPGPNKLTSFFGWKTSPPATSNKDQSAAQQTTPATVEARLHEETTYDALAESSIVPSPKSTFAPALAPQQNGINLDSGTFYADNDQNQNTTHSHKDMEGLPNMDGLQIDMGSQMDHLEDELREVSEELAGSIRREIELEDLVDRLQYEASQGMPDSARRTSDYFSDSGSGSARYMGPDATSKLDDLAKQKRVSEQGQARSRLSLSQKLQIERERRKVLEAHVQQMSNQISSIDQERAISSGVVNKARELEDALDDHRRKLAEERRTKENFEDLLSALKGEIAQYKDERDNLREEIVPQLKSRVEGLEKEAEERQQTIYDRAGLQQELQTLKEENTTLMNARRMQMDMQQQSARFNSIAEEDEAGASANPTHSSIMTRSLSTRMASGLGRAGSLKRSNSISSKEREFNERVKDIEDQRDALHKALKLLLDRQTMQHRQHERKVAALETQLAQAAQDMTPRRAGYEQEVKYLKSEIQQLRRRADDALHQKYQCEKGLGGLKMDLDRAEQETSSLRSLLQENDILVPDRPGSRSKEVESQALATSESLEKAYRALQRTQALAISRLRDLHGEPGIDQEDSDTRETMNRLMQSMSNAEAENAFAQKQAIKFRVEAESLIGENSTLSTQLQGAASRVEGLSQQVCNQLNSNSSLRQRLAEAVGRGEQQQRDSVARINGMQGRLKELEDQLMTAQQDSEEAFATHEDSVRDMQESHNGNLHRLRGSLRVRTSNILSPRSAGGDRSPFSHGRCSPRLGKTTSGLGKSLDQALRTEFLEKRVAELEGALTEADKEMQEVVGRMNIAQIEVMELQSARDDAMRQTRKLQTAINAEREQVDSLIQ